MATVSTVINDIKTGFRTTEFYLSAFVTGAGAFVQFLPVSEANDLTKAIALGAAILATVGYTASRTIIKTN